MSGTVRTSIPGGVVRLIVACVVAVASTAACGASNLASGPKTADSPTATQARDVKDCVVGASFFNIADGDTMDFLEPTLEQAIPAVFGSSSYKARDAKSMSETQVQDIDELVRNGATVLILAPSSDRAYLPAVQRAIEAGIPVLAIRQPIAARSLYIGFDPVEEGRQAAKALLAVKPKGTYAVVTSSVPVPEGDPVAAGIREALQPAADRGDITIAPVEWRWDGSPTENLTTMLSLTGQRVDAVVAVSDSLASEVQAALAEAGLADKVAIAGVGDYGFSDGLFGVARGTQAVTVWANGELVAKAVAQAAIALCRNPDITKVDGSASVTWPGQDPMTAILLKPVTITKDNLSTVINTDMYWRQLVCGNSLGLDRPELPACQLGPVPAASASAQSQP